MNLYPARTAKAAESRIPDIMHFGVWKQYSMLLQFFGLPIPSFIKSQFMPSVRPSLGWHPLHDCQFW